MASYVPGDRLWVRVEGFDWWPARVLSDAQLAEKLGEGAREPGCDLAVLFYAGTHTGESAAQLSSASDAHNICFFETSSEKAVTDSEDLRAAIQAASEDVHANPLRVDQGPAGGSGPVRHAGQARKVAKRGRATRSGSDSDDDAGDVGGPRDVRGQRNRGAAGSPYKHLPMDTLTTLARRIGQAVAEEDVPTLRIELCGLDGVDVSLAELETSKIGVAVGNILGSQACAPLWPLARALVSFWARHLQPETLAAIRRVQAGSQVRGGAGVLPIPGSPTVGSPTSPTFGSPAGTQAPTLATRPRGQRRSFVSTLCDLLDSPDATVPVSVEVVEKVARELAAEVRGEDERGVLLARLRNPDLSYVRDNLVHGRWTARQYLEQPDDAFVTRKEKEAEEERLREKLKAFDNAQMVGVNFTEMFKCANCGKRETTFYEQQTRGADEPTTKFITCLHCKKAWTEE